jgi:plasmid stability protein
VEYDIIELMASIVIRRLDERVKIKLRVRAAQRGHSMEEEARSILSSAVSRTDAPAGNLAERIRQRFAPVGGVELKIPRRGLMRPPINFDSSK